MARDVQAFESMEHVNPVIEMIQRSESLPANVSAVSAFESVIGCLIQRLLAEYAMEFVERRLPTALGELLQRDAEEALEDGFRDQVNDYMDEVSGQLKIDALQARDLTYVVIGSLRMLMSAQEVQAIASQLAPELANLWTEACDVPGASTVHGEP